MQRQKGGAQIYGEPTVTLTIKVPQSKKDEVRGLFYQILDGYVRPALNRKEEIEAIDNRKNKTK